MRFLFRHFTAILILVVIAAWAAFYLPTTPAWSVIRLKQAIDAHNGSDAANFIDFPSVVQNAGQQMVKNRANDPISQMFGTAAVAAFTGPMAQFAKSWAVDQVNQGRKDLQMPLPAMAGAIVLMHRDGDSAFTRWTDPKGQTYGVHFTREGDGVWRISEVENADQLLQKLKQHTLNTP